MNTRKIAEEIFLAGINSVIPSNLIPGQVKIEENTLRISGRSFNLNDIKNIYVIGFGKATASMAAEAEKILGKRISDGHIIVKYGHSCRLKRIKVTEAGHPVPDENGFKATRSILEIARKATEDDLVLCLISGGGSALLADYPEGSSPEDMMKISSLLVNCGASITEINAVRKHLSLVKGGQLARAVYPATLVSLILSDVAGDPLDVIASGPTAPDPTTFRNALEVLENYDLKGSCPSSLLRYLEDGSKDPIRETPKKNDLIFTKTHNMLIGTNSTALEAARMKALEYNINALIIDSKLQGDVVSVSEYLAETALQFKNDVHEVKPVCLLFGGETTVKMTGSGSGGRNQHLALLMSLLLKDYQGITMLSGGTDGNDGNTDAAGAVVDSKTFQTALSKNIDPQEFLKAFDSYHFFRKVGGLISTGPTKTNVMDLIATIVE
jgi:hydroxypyruvate reductase/glycerate 2-kinase